MSIDPWISSSFGDHEWDEVVERDEHFGKDVKWAVCRRCGCRIAQDERTQSFPSLSCDAEIVKGVMRS
jgi:hypothetical protein